MTHAARAVRSGVYHGGAAVVGGPAGRDFVSINNEHICMAVHISFIIAGANTEG